MWIVQVEKGQKEEDVVSKRQGPPRPQSSPCQNQGRLDLLRVGAATHPGLCTGLSGISLLRQTPTLRGSFHILNNLALAPPFLWFKSKMCVSLNNNNWLSFSMHSSVALKISTVYLEFIAAA